MLLHALSLALQDQTAPAVPPTEALPPTEDAPAGGMNFMLPMLLIAAIFWIVLIGPERKQRKKRAAMIAALAKGDRVVTTAGIFATVVSVQDDMVVLQVADGVRMHFSRAAVQTVIEDPAKVAEAKPEK